MSGTLPAGTDNGLAAIVHQLVTDPESVHVVVALIDTVKITQKIDDDSSTPTVRIRRIEAPANDADRQLARAILDREFERRTGQDTLPFDTDTKE